MNLLVCLQVILIVLKISGVINWIWWLLLIPTWVSLAIIVWAVILELID